MSSFMDLAPELQDMIWRYAVQAIEPRNIQLRLSIPSRGERSRQCTSIATIPPLLHACHQSRELSMKRWQLSFREVSYCEIEVIPRSPAKVWFDHNDDTLTLFYIYLVGDANYKHILLTDHYGVRLGSLEFVTRLAFELGELHEWELVSHDNEPMKCVVVPPIELTEEDTEDDKRERAMDLMRELYPGLQKMFLLENTHHNHEDFRENGALKPISFTSIDREMPEYYADNLVEAYRQLDGRELEFTYVRMEVIDG